MRRKRDREGAKEKNHAAITNMSFVVRFAQAFLSVVVNPVFEQGDEFHRFSTVDHPTHFRCLRITFLLQEALRTNKNPDQQPRFPRLLGTKIVSHR